MATMTPTRPPVLNLPNQLTAARFVLAVVLFVLIAVKWWGWCLGVFTAAAFTDWLDGYLARLNNQTSALGRNLDPLVDKVLMCGTYIFLLPQGSEEGWLLPWMVTLVVGRELVITSLRSFLENLGARFGSDWLGKAKMGLQCAAVIAIFVMLQWPAPLGTLGGWLRDGLIWAMLLATVLSAAQYLWRATTILTTDAVR
jgi:CDP-diacylglycerol--glycerol-3-phosphate 3-phosphatidyltransferase